jgi:dTDP-4-dehydrorhamnose 3,5-epimerase
MEFVPTTLPGVILIRPRIFGDERGFFFESWHERKFAAAGIDARFVQDNHSHSVRHTLRGLHYQVRRPQGKLVWVTRGEVYDVAVDVRRGSACFGQWVGILLNEQNRHMLWIPPGFAHGYLALGEQVDFLYKCTDFYSPEYERAVAWNDREIGVAWPLSEGVAPLLSPKDAAAPCLAQAEVFP